MYQEHLHPKNKYRTCALRQRLLHYRQCTCKRRSNMTQKSSTREVDRWRKIIIINITSSPHGNTVLSCKTVGAFFLLRCGSSPSSSGPLPSKNWSGASNGAPFSGQKIEEKWFLCLQHYVCHIYNHHQKIPSSVPVKSRSKGGLSAP